MAKKEMKDDIIVMVFFMTVVGLGLLIIYGVFQLRDWLITLM